MKALILAAGFGTRMQPFTHTMPKALAPVNDIPLLIYNLALLKKNGITDIVINLHHHGAKIKTLLKNGKHLGLNLRYSIEPIILGTGGGIKKALRFLDNDFLVMNADIITDFNLKKLITTHKKQKTLATLCLYETRQRKKYDVLHFRDNTLLSIINKPKPDAPAKTASFMGVHIISKPKLQDFLKKNPQKNKFCITSCVYIPTLINHNPLGAYPVSKAVWRVCDSLADTQKVTKELKTNNITLSYQKELNHMQKKLPCFFT